MSTLSQSPGGGSGGSPGQQPSGEFRQPPPPPERPGSQPGPEAGVGPAAEPLPPPLPSIPVRPVAVRMVELTKVYDGKLALDHLSLDIHEGDIFGYIGPNGAGKTTTLRILAGLLLPTRGAAQIAGVDVRKKPRKIKELVGYMPDSFGVYDNMTLYEYLDFFAAAYRISRQVRRKVIDDVLTLTDLGAKRDDQVSVFSRGMKQRACLAKTLLHNPRVLLLDEPASGLDPRARIEFRELMKELQKMGKTILVSSHILTELSTVCDSVGIIEAGRLITAGPVDDILTGLHADREFVLDLLDPADGPRARSIIEGRPAVRDVSVDGSRIVFRLGGADPEAAAMVDALVGAGIRLTAFREERVDLEDAFMALTRGKLA